MIQNEIMSYKEFIVCQNLNSKIIIGTIIFKPFFTPCEFLSEDKNLGNHGANQKFSRRVARNLLVPPSFGETENYFIPHTSANETGLPCDYALNTNKILRGTQGMNETRITFKFQIISFDTVVLQVKVL